MPCTFGLIFPLKKTITFVHTNTSFKVPHNLRGRDFTQQVAHNMMLKVTAMTSYKLLFTSQVTKDEYINFTKINKKSNLFVIENGIDVARFEKGKNSVINSLENKKFILSVSQIYRLKNFDTLIKSYLKLLKMEKQRSN